MVEQVLLKANTNSTCVVQFLSVHPGGSFKIQKVFLELQPLQQNMQTHEYWPEVRIELL